jgi:hypothetical protein
VNAERRQDQIALSGDLQGPLVRGEVHRRADGEYPFVRDLFQRGLQQRVVETIQVRVGIDQHCLLCATPHPVTLSGYPRASSRCFRMTALNASDCSRGMLGGRHAPAGRC